MDNRIKMTPWDFFMHLLGFVALYASVISILALMFQYINVIFPDKLNFYYTGILDIIRIASSALLVLFVVFILVNWLLEKDFTKNPAKRELRFRKWLIYFTLFVSAVTIIIDLIRLTNNFYSGELSSSFIFKVLAVLIIAAAVFGYYFWDLKRATDKKYQLPKILAWLTSAVVLISIIGGFFIVGSPATQRQRRFDDQRISNLQEIQNQIINYWQQKEALPGKLVDLNDSISGFVTPVDPETNSAYEYNVTLPLTFELCSNFKTVSFNSAAGLNLPEPATYYADPYKQNWSHGTGRVCFSRTIDPELYKINKNVIEKPIR